MNMNSFYYKEFKKSYMIDCSEGLDIVFRMTTNSNRYDLRLDVPLTLKAYLNFNYTSIRAKFNAYDSYMLREIDPQRLPLFLVDLKR